MEEKHSLDPSLNDLIFENENKNERKTTDIYISVRKRLLQQSIYIVNQNPNLK